MTNKPLISIIIPVFNAEDFLAKCLESVIGQTYTNLEIILINDGSHDNSLEICRTYAARDNRIIVLTQENQGNSVARNKGIETAKGEFITFIDADDFVDSRLVELLLDSCIANNTLLSISDGYIYKDFSDIKEIDDVENLTDNTLIPSDYNGMYHHTPWRKLYHRSLLANIRFPNGLYHEDIGFWYGVMSVSPNISVVKKPLYYYRQNNQNSITIREIDILRRSLDGVRSFEYGLKLIEENAKDKKFAEMVNALVESYYELPFICEKKEWFKKQAEFLNKLKKYKPILNKTNKSKLNKLLCQTSIKFKKHFDRFMYPIINFPKWITEPIAIVRYGIITLCEYLYCQYEDLCKK